MRKRIGVIGACAFVLIAVGSSPRYLQKLRIRGGYGEQVDGGADLEADGDIWSDGVIGAAGSNTEALTAGVPRLHRGVVTAWEGAGGDHRRQLARVDEASKGNPTWPLHSGQGEPDALEHSTGP